MKYFIIEYFIWFPGYTFVQVVQSLFYLDKKLQPRIAEIEKNGFIFLVKHLKCSTVPVFQRTPITSGQISHGSQEEEETSFVTRWDRQRTT